jgi:Tol biopolymer transport system component/predicted Ser/Thr protein kinase
MSLPPSTKLGPYEIISAAGAGGMGEVYQARDTRLERIVAIKVLPPHLASNADLKQRLEREAKTISSLNHPHICTLYDVGHQDGTDYLVMEFLEGESLSKRLEKGALQVREVLKIGVEIADALDKAHRSGIVHRDLKPGNIMLTKSGAKLLDFGLAKPAAASAAAIGNMTGAATMTSPASPITQQGTIVGTFQYMSPEQIEGKEADSRSDNFAFGAVLYEMATGKRAFQGKSQLSVASAILEKEPEPISSIQPMTPAALTHVINRALAKDAEDRWQSAADVKAELKWISEGGSQVGAPAVVVSHRKNRERIAWSMAAIGTFLAVAFAVAWNMRAPVAPAAPAVVRSQISIPSQLKLDIQNGGLALSPDGRRMAMAARSADGKQQIWIRALDNLSSQVLAGSEGATYPFWSPDGQSLGFFANGKLKKIELSSGTAQTLCDAADGRGASWSSRGVVVFSPSTSAGLYQVSATGGSSTQVTTPDGKPFSARLPQFLPDGKHLLFVSLVGNGTSPNGVFALDLETKKITVVAHEKSEMVYVDPGYLVFVRDKNLMAQRFDVSSLRLAGEAFILADSIQYNSVRFKGSFTVSNSGLLIFLPASAQLNVQPTWYDLDGKKLGKMGQPAPIAGASLSPDGNRVLAPLFSNDRLNLWMYQVSSGLASRFTFGDGPDHAVVWSPDGKQVVYTDNFKWFFKETSGTSEARIIENGFVNSFPQSWSPDGKLLAYVLNDGTGIDIWMYPISGDPKPYPFITGPGNQDHARFSPDGRWLLYTSGESGGRREAFVVPFPEPGGKWQVSADPVDDVAWLRDGHQIVFTTPDRKLMSVDVSFQGREMTLGKTTPLFGGNALPEYWGSATPLGDVLSRDGKRILLPESPQQINSVALTLVSNWMPELKKQ